MQFPRTSEWSWTPWDAIDSIATADRLVAPAGGFCWDTFYDEPDHEILGYDIDFGFRNPYFTVLPQKRPGGKYIPVPTPPGTGIALVPKDLWTWERPSENITTAFERALVKKQETDWMFGLGPRPGWLDKRNWMW